MAFSDSQSRCNSQSRYNSQSRCNALLGVDMHLLRESFQHLSHLFSGLLSLVPNELAWTACNIPDA